MILAASHVGYPLSTTQTISGAVIGSGAAKRLSAVRWGVAGNIVLAWVLTLPAAATIGALTYGVTRLFGTGAAGPVIVSGLILAGGGAPVRAPRPAAGALGAGGGVWMIAGIVDLSDLVNVIWVSLVAGIGVTCAFGVAILGGTRAVDSSREGRVAQAAAFGVLGSLAMLAVVGSIVFGIVILVET